MKITFVLPAIGKKTGESYITTWKKMEPLTIAVLKALTPPDIETEFFDDRMEFIDYTTETDLVAIPAEMYTAKRAYEIAARFRKRGIPVIMGGYHATLCPEEVLEHADAVVIGNADDIWVNVIADAYAKKLQKKYLGRPIFGYNLPDRSIYKDKKYSPIALVETGRGCNHACEFCAITASYQASYYPRPISEIIDDIRRANKEYVFFVDDNIVANPQYAIDLFKAIVPLKIKWTAQATLTIAQNPEMLFWMKKSGCEVILIGYESLDMQNLNQMKKDWSVSLGERDLLTKAIHDAGINIYATFVFGFDFDTSQTFERASSFARRHKFFFTAFNHLLPFPGTKLHKRLLQQDVCYQDRWWLKDGYCYGDIPFIPKHFSAEELSEQCAKIRREFFTLLSIFWRGMALLRRNWNPLLFAIFWVQNLNLRKEVDGKLGMPIGRGLDEKPK
mgnify:CR=1 FL=1